MVQRNTPKTLYKSEFAKSAYQPTRSPEAAPFWEGCREHRLMLPRCSACECFHFYPRAFCPHCGARALEWRRSAGRGVVYSFAVVRQPLEKAFEARVPYAIAIIDLEEGVRMQSQLVDVDVDAVGCGDAVEVTFLALSETLVIPVFRPTPEGGG